MPENPLHLVAPELAPVLEFFPQMDFRDGIEAVRGGFDDRERPPLPPELAVVQAEERFIPSIAGAPDVRVLHYTPPGTPDKPRGALLHIHGGGFVLGTADIGDAGNRAIALALGITVVSVDYRLAPETVWPGALEDCYSALVWLHDNAAELGIDPKRIALAGESAGGGHAVALALHARNRVRETGRGPSICFQLLYALIPVPQEHPVKRWPKSIGSQHRKKRIWFQGACEC